MKRALLVFLTFTMMWGFYPNRGYFGPTKLEASPVIGYAVVLVIGFVAGYYFKEDNEGKKEKITKQQFVAYKKQYKVIGYNKKLESCSSWNTLLSSALKECTNNALVVKYELGSKEECKKTPKFIYNPGKPNNTRTPYKTEKNTTTVNGGGGYEPTTTGTILPPKKSPTAESIAFQEERTVNDRANEYDNHTDPSGNNGRLIITETRRK